jgi:uncharacterized membrane protein
LLRSTGSGAGSLDARKSAPLMTRLFEADPAERILWIALLAVLLVIAGYVLGKIRAKTVQQEPMASELLAKFSELHSRGVLSDVEFRTIKTTLAAQLQDELKSNDEKG